MTFNSDREALRALYEAVYAYGQTEDSDDHAERVHMFNVMDDVFRFLASSEPEADNDD